jgi:hypothetical protein
MKNLRKLSRNELRNVNGGKNKAFACYCDGVYKKDCSTVACCLSACEDIAAS